MPHKASPPEVPDNPFPDNVVGPSTSDSQKEGLTGQPLLDAADVMCAVMVPGSQDGYHAANLTQNLLRFLTL